MSAGFTLDAGALIAFERNDREVVAMLMRAIDADLDLVVPAGVVAKVWRDGRKQARLARLLGTRRVSVEVLDDARARQAGQLCGATATADVIEASVVLCARARKHKIITSDPQDLRRLDPRIELVEI